MAKTALAAVGDQVPEVWAADLFAQAEDLTFWYAFEGEPGSNMPIIRRNELESSNAGDTVRVDIVLDLEGEGQTGDTTAVEGNEEELKFRQMSVAVDALAHGVRWTKLGKILINHDMRGTALMQMRKWLAGKLDTDIFKMLSGEATSTNAAVTLPTNAKHFAGTGNSAIADVASTDLVTLDSLVALKTIAQVTNKIEPLRLENGEEIFGLCLHPYATAELKQSSDWKQAQREARERGLTNPLFTGATAVYDGVLIYTNNRVRSALDGTATARVARNVFFGAQALSRVYAYYPDWTEEYFDYGREQGIATYLVKGETLNIFDLTNAGGAAAADKTAIGHMVFYSAAPDPTN